MIQEQEQEPRVLCTDGEAAGGQVLPGCSSQGRRICSKPWQRPASQLMWALQTPSPSSCAPKAALLRAPINLLGILGASCKNFWKLAWHLQITPRVSPGEPAAQLRDSGCAGNADGERGWGSRERQQQQDCQPPACAQAWGRERRLSLGWGFHRLPSSAALSHPAASARRGKQGCSDTEQGFVRSWEPRLGRNPKMRFAIKPRSGKQGWWRIRRCHPPASASGRGEAERHALARGSRPLSLGGMDPELVVTEGKWGCWEQERRRDRGISAVCGGEADLEPEGTGKWGDVGAAREKLG